MFRISFRIRILFRFSVRIGFSGRVMIIKIKASYPLYPF